MGSCCRIATAAIALCAATGCDRPNPIVICHNANCAGPVDLSRDDTLPALRESLALTYDGRPAIDGVEIDLVWDAASARCVFAHDPPASDASPPGAEETTHVLVDYLEGPGEVSWNGDCFYVKIELKGAVARNGRGHTPSERDLHADCVLEQLALLDDAAARTGRAVEVIFDSADPALLDALRARPTWPPQLASDRVRVRLAADFGAPAPFGSDTQPLRGFADIDIVEIHPSWLTDAAYQAYVSLGVDLNIWMFSATTETFAAIERFDPEYIGTGEVPLLRRWLEN